MNLHLSKYEDDEDGATLVDAFYEKVLYSLVEHLYKEYKYRHNGIKEDTIHLFQNTVKAHLQHPKQLFQVAEKYRVGSSWTTNIEAATHQCKASEQNNSIKFPFQKLMEQLGLTKDILAFLNKDDYLKFLKEELKIKLEDPPVKKEEGADLFLSSIESEDSSEATVDYCKYLNCRIVGAYQANALNYRAKEDKSSVHFTDVFIKSPDGQRYLENLFMETKKIDKRKVNKYFP